jgi:hypothetical protein
MQFHHHPVQGVAGHVDQAAQFFALEQAGRLAMAVLGQQRLVGRDDDQAGLAIEDQPLVVFDQLAGAVQADHRRHVHAARQDGGVRGGAAQVDGEAQRVLQRQHVAGGDVGGHVDGRLAGRAQPAHAGQLLQHAVGDLLDVAPAFAQVGIVELGKLIGQMIGLRGHRPLGVPALVDHVIERGVGQRRIVEDHRVDLEQRPRLGGRIGRQFFGQRRDVALDLVDRLAKPGGFSRTQIFGNVITRHIEAARLEHPGTADDDTPANAGATDAEHSDLLAETRRDQARQRGNRFFLVRAGGLDHQGRALGGRQHHHPHDALGIDSTRALGHPDFALEPGRQLRDLGRWPRVHAKLVDDDRFKPLHRILHSHARRASRAAPA